MECSVLTNKKLEETCDKIKEWKQTKRNLISRADSLKAQADSIQRTDPSKALKLYERSKVLYDEALKMSDESRRGMSTAQIRRSAVQGKLQLAADGVKNGHRKQ